MEDSWIDVSVALHGGMVHRPDNQRGDVANVSEISMGSHTGTRMDAPLHFFRDARGSTRCRSTRPWGARG